MIVRLRSRDGLERVEVGDNETVGKLKQLIKQQLKLEQDQIYISKDRNLLIANSPQAFTDLNNDQQPLKSCQVEHGSQVYLWYPGERQVPSTIKKTVLDSRPFGQHMTVEDMVSRQVRIERQDEPHCASVSFDRGSAYSFQAYVHQTLAFSIKRAGIMYGYVDEENNVMVEVIIEPPQEGSADTVLIERDSQEEKMADFLAEKFGLKKVGFIFSQSTKERDYIMSSEELIQMAAWQDELGETCVTVVVLLDMSEEGAGNVHFEAFQCSDQAVRLYKTGWFKSDEEPKGVIKLRNPLYPQDLTPAINIGKDVGEVDNDWFLVAVKIRDHEGAFKSDFPIENRLVMQSKADFKGAIKQNGNSIKKPLHERLADFHLLLWLAKQRNLDLSDFASICDSIHAKEPITEGYSLIIESLAD
eukprot:TRINITY_DN4377_c0_g1_i2.p1 TRINITY_DN4377_c0_g1~~TRINITY_DN4377_c0_g1_i2.p1  ORF type:complete len:415 (+),score=71.98 TRINITY_DN4377_c0_g1_i2:901-2145(+)